eukprot:5244185-Pyramimonas_sp.AAC.1
MNPKVRDAPRRATRRIAEQVAKPSRGGVGGGGREERALVAEFVNTTRTTWRGDSPLGHDVNCSQLGRADSSPGGVSAGSRVGGGVARTAVLL